MAKKSKKIKTKVVFLLLLIITWKCANQLPPGGGPVDNIPPEIVYVYPQNGSFKYDENYLKIEFSEYVDKRSVREAVFISPPLKNSLDFDWSGRTLKLIIKDTLKENTTYTVTIGASVSDLNNSNKMIEPFTFAFSTGEIVDVGEISGKIYDSDPKGVMVYAYKSENEEFNPSIQKPDYVSQVGKNGRYTLLGLSNGNYNVLAVKDLFMDLLYQSGDDKYGVQPFNITITNDKKIIGDVDFFLTAEDTTAPHISYSYMKNSNQIIIEFSKPIDSSKTTANNFYLYDSTTSNEIPILYFFKGDAKNRQYYLSFKDTLNDKNEIYLISREIPDKSNNILKKEETILTVDTGKDTASVKIINVLTDYPDEKIDYDEPKLIINLNKGVDRTKAENAVSIIDHKGNGVKHSISFIDDASFKIFINQKLQPRTNYKLQLNMNYLVDAVGNIGDSIYTFRFSTLSDLDFSGISGNVTNNIDIRVPFVVLESVENKDIKYQQKTSQKSTYDLRKIIPGKYLLWSFIDRNNDGEYTKGTIKPFILSERFKYYPDTLNLRARWPVGDVNIEFNK